MESEYRLKNGTQVTRREAIQIIADSFGYEEQSRQCMEEMAELSLELNKFLREVLEFGEIHFEEIDPAVSSVHIANILEEIVDVEIMLDQMQYLLHLDPELMERMDVYKINRTLERI